MEQLKANSILKFNQDQVKIVRQALGYDDVNKLKQDIEHLASWIKMQNHFRVKEFDPEYLERLLIYNKGSIERTKQKFDRLCTSVNLMPEFLQNFDMRNEFHAVLNVFNVCMLPMPISDNYRVLAANFTGQDDSKFDLVDFYRYFIAMGYYVLNNDYCHGYEMVGDTRNITMGTITKINPIVIHKALTLIVETMSLRMKKIHLISGSKLFDTLFVLLKQGLSAKLKERIVIHPTVESLHEHIPKEHLPKDLGGDEKTMSELCDIQYKELCSDEFIAKLKSFEKTATDEACRLVCKFNEEYSGMPGSFKTLCVD